MSCGPAVTPVTPSPFQPCYRISMAKKTLLLPREHGAYAQLTFPLLTGLALSGATPGAVALAAAAVLIFLANEPLAVILGARGDRLRNQLGERARLQGLLLTVGGIGLAGLGLTLGWPAVWPSILVPAVAGLGLIPLALTGRQKSLPGEILVLTAFSTLVLPLAAQSGVPMLRATLAAGVWWVSFTLGTLEVHAIKARIKKRSPYPWTRQAAPLAAGMSLMGALWLALGQAAPLFRSLEASGAWEGLPGTGVFPAPELMRLLPPAGAALLPPTLAILILGLMRVHPRHLKRVGWTLVGVNTLTLVLILQGN